MVKNSLTKLLTSNPSVGEEISKLTTKEDIFAALKKHISGYTEEQMIKDFTEIKASAEIASDEKLDAEALENVAGGALSDIDFGGIMAAATPAVGVSLATYQQTRNAYDAFKK
jgi:hypothetical protein